VAETVLEADELLLAGVLGLSDSTITALRTGADLLSKRRRTR
jgi:hypothetical protein